MRLFDWRTKKAKAAEEAANKAKTAADQAVVEKNQAVIAKEKAEKELKEVKAENARKEFFAREQAEKDGVKQQMEQYLENLLVPLLQNIQLKKVTH